MNMFQNTAIAASIAINAYFAIADKSVFSGFLLGALIGVVGFTYAIDRGWTVYSPTPDMGQQHKESGAE